jgi:D-threo-aldose 1-dehydrogenase
MTISLPRHDAVVDVGRHGVRITQLGLGTAPLGGLFTSVSETESDAVIASAMLAGIRYFDTAPLYGHTRAESRLGRGLVPYSNVPVTISTKVGITMGELDPAQTSLYLDAEPFTPRPDFRRSEVRPTLLGSMKRLRIARAGIVFIHEPEDHMELAMTETIEGLLELREQGLIGSIGVGTNFSETAVRFIAQTDIDIVLLGGRYTILDQVAQAEVLPAALERGVSIIAGSVFNSGVFVAPSQSSTYNYAPVTGDILSRTLAIHAVLADFGVTPAAAALQFPLRHPAVCSVLTGARTVQEVEQNIRDFDRPVPEELWVALEQRELIEARTT